MKKLFIAVVACVALALCACNKEEDKTPDFPDEHPLEASYEAVSSQTAVLGTIGEDLASAIKARFLYLSSNISDETKIVIVPWESIQLYSDIVLDSYEKGKTIVVAEPDNASLDKWLADHGINSLMFETEDRNLIVAFNRRGWQYGLDNPLDDTVGIVANLSAYLNPFVSWINAAVSTPSAPIADIASEGSVDITKTFDHVRVEQTFHIHLKKELGHMLWSSPDIVEASSLATISIEYYPLYAFEDQMSPGDYYVMSAKMTVENRPMYKGYWINKHGGLKTHLCAYIFDSATMEFELLDSKSNSVKPKFDNGPFPETTSLNVSHEEGMSWSLGGSVTGGWEGSGPAALLSVSGGVSFSNSTMISYKDILVYNNCSSGKVNIKYYLDVDASGYIQGFSLYEPTAPVCKSNLVSRASWVWRVPDTKDNSTVHYKMKITPKVSYSALRFYSSVAEAYIPVFTGAITDSPAVIDLKAPNRVPTGQWKINNSEAQGTYLSDIKVWKESEFQKGTPVYSSSESVASGDSRTIILPVGSYRAECKVGKSASQMTTRKCRAFKISRGDIMISNSGFDFE